MASPKQPTKDNSRARPSKCGGARLPFVAQLSPELDRGQTLKIERLAREQKARDPRLGSTEAFGPRVACGLGSWPSLVFEDHSGISLYNPRDDRRYSYRALMLAGDADVVALSIERNLDFETYCRDTLNLGRVEVWTPRAEHPFVPLTRRCAGDRRFLERLAQLAEAHRGLNLLPYMGDGRAWSLARTIAERAKVEIRVAAAPPRLTNRVNDKLWFEARVEEVLGRSALPEVRSANGPALLAHHVKDLARRYASVAIKVPASASSLGNVVLEAGKLSGLSLAALRDELYGLLRRTGWLGDFPLLVTAWEQPILASPSLQVWIPRPAEALPIIEGIFEQVLAGRSQAFVGAAPSELSSKVWLQLAEEGLQLAYLLQKLGYFGRCSFDAILVGDGGAETRAHWVECNGRWGGVSVPMTLVNRLVGNWMRRPFVVANEKQSLGCARPFSAILETLKDGLFAEPNRTEGAVILTPGPIEAGDGFDLLVMADSIAAARDRAAGIAVDLVAAEAR